VRHKTENPQNLTSRFLLRLTPGSATLPKTFTFEETTMNLKVPQKAINGRSPLRWSLLCLMCLTPMSRAARSRPNVLLFFTDDQRASTIGALGNPDIQTPNLDQLVAQGTAFTRAYMMGGMTGATCVPSRAMLHTGRHLFHLRNKGHDYPSSHTTLGETFRAAGYTTYFTGKRHSLTRKRIQAGYAEGGVVMGFGGYLTDKRRMPMHDWDPDARYAKKDAYIVSGARGFPKVPVPSYANKESVPSGPYATELYINPAVEWIHTYDRSEPWFMYVALSAPHDPHEAPEETRRLYDPNVIPLPPNFRPLHPFDNGDMDVRDETLLPKPRDPQQIKQQIADYYAAITFVDSQFGRLITALQECQQLDNTIIAFVGDSGLAVGQHGLLGKQNLYDDGGVHIPLLLAGPGIPVNEERAALVASCDIFPTLCELTDIAIPKPMDGRSMRPLLLDPTFRTHDTIYLGYREYQRAVVEKRYKLIEYIQIAKGKQERIGTRKTQLFDLQEDPWETTNLAQDPSYAAILKQLQEKLLDLRHNYHDGTDQGKRLCPDMHAQYQLFWQHYH